MALKEVPQDVDLIAWNRIGLAHCWIDMHASLYILFTKVRIHMQ